MSIHAKSEQPTSLKDKLASLTVHSAGACAFGRIANDLDDETRQALFDAKSSSSILRFHQCVYISRYVR